MECNSNSRNSPTKMIQNMGRNGGIIISEQKLKRRRNFERRCLSFLLYMLKNNDANSALECEF